MEFQFFNRRIKITHSQVQIIVLCLAVLLILFPLTVWFFQISLDEKLAGDISTWIMIAAALLFFWSRKKQNEENAAAKKKKDEEEASEKRINEPKNGVADENEAEKNQ